MRSSRRMTAYAATRWRFGSVPVGAHLVAAYERRPPRRRNAERGTSSSSSAAAPVRGVSAEVGGVPRRVLPVGGPVAGQPLHVLEHRRQARPSSPVTSRRSSSGATGSGAPKPDVDQTTPGEVRPGPARHVPTEGQSRWPPQTTTRHERRTGLAGERGGAGHQRAHGVASGRCRPRGRRRRPRPRAAAGERSGTPRRARPVDRDVPHPVHGPADRRDRPRRRGGTGSAPGARRASAACSMSTKSGKETWIAASTTGPRRGQVLLPAHQRTVGPEQAQRRTGPAR